MPLSIFIYENELYNASRKVLLGVIISGILIGITLIGSSVTPRNIYGRSVILTPRVAEISSYQKKVRRWVQEMFIYEVCMRTLLNSNVSDLYSQDNSFQEINRNVNRLSSEIDHTDTPSSLVGLHELIANAVLAHQQASLALGQWLSAPSTSTQDIAYISINNANHTLEQLNGNPWVLIDQKATFEK